MTPLEEALVAERRGEPQQEQGPPADGEREVWTSTDEAKFALDSGVRSSYLSPRAQLEYDRLVAEGYGTPPQEERSATRDEHEEARRKRDEEASRWLEEHRKLPATIWLPVLGVAVRDGRVYQHGVDQGGSEHDAKAAREHRNPAQMKLLGALAGAHAEVVSGKVGKRRTGHERAGDVVILASLVGPLALLAGISRAGTGIAVVTFPDGSARQKRFTDKASLAKAQAEAARFNALAASSQPAHCAASGSPEGSAADDTRIAAELQHLAALHASGVLDDEEFRAAKARIISG
jgi:hypothetical protein